MYRSNQSPYQASPNKLGISTRSRFEGESPNKQDYSNNDGLIL